MPQIYQIQRLINQVFQLWSVEEVVITIKYDRVIALTVTINEEAHSFKVPDNWKCLPLPDKQWVCVSSLPWEDYFSRGLE